jgi:hypothetical protein
LIVAEAKGLAMKKKEEIRDIPAFFARLWESHEDAMVFRGQPKAWPLLPRISRWPEASKGSENWRVFQEVVLNDFAKFASPYIGNPPSETIQQFFVDRILKSHSDPFYNLPSKFGACGIPERLTSSGT